MSKVDFFIQAGQVIRQKRTFSDDEGSGLFSLVKLWKKLADRFHVPYVDDCCNPADETNLPIRYNKTAAKIQYYNDTNDTWTNLSSF